MSDSNYIENSKYIITWYTSGNNKIKLKYLENDKQCQNDVKCSRVSTSQVAYGIKKQDAEKIYNLYNFDGDITDYFLEHQIYNDQYLFLEANTQGECQYYVYHNLTAVYINSTDIRITDKQEVNEYEYGIIHTNEDIISIKKQTVIYEFKQDIDGNYYLFKVDLK